MDAAPDADAMDLEWQLHDAANLGKIDDVRALLDQGVSADAVSADWGACVLLTASISGFVAIVELLLSRGATIDAVDDTGRTALSYACRHANLDMAALLLTRGAAVTFDDEDGKTALSYASEKGPLAIVELLVAHGADINHRDADQNTPLLRAAFHDHLPICEFLLRKGADLTASNEEDETVMSDYGKFVRHRLSPETIKLRCATLKVARADYELASLRSTIESLESRVAVLERPAHINASMLFSEAFADLVFVCPGGERIHAHRNIVAAASIHMSALLQGPWAENANANAAVGRGSEVGLPQSAPAVRALLRFLYTGEVDAAAIQTSMSDVLDLASQHEQPALKAACEQHAIAALSVPTVVPLLVAAHLHDLAALRARCVDLVKANMAAVTLSSPFWKLKTTHPLLWRELRVALGLPEEEEEEEVGDACTRDHKRGRLDK